MAEDYRARSCFPQDTQTFRLGDMDLLGHFYAITVHSGVNGIERIEARLVVRTGKGQECPTVERLLALATGPGETRRLVLQTGEEAGAAVITGDARVGAIYHCGLVESPAIDAVARLAEVLMKEHALPHLTWQRLNLHMNEVNVELQMTGSFRVQTLGGTG